MNDDELLIPTEMQALDTIRHTNWVHISDLGAIVVWLESRGLVETNPAGYVLLTPAGHDLYQPMGVGA